MIPKQGANPHKGMIFAGCSFTWGQGLYYYSNLPSLKEPPPDAYDSKLVSYPHIKFMESVRYPRIVADHFDSFEFVYPGNGGSNEGAIDWWMHCFTKEFPGHVLNGYKVPPIDPKEISYVIFQLTQWQRDHFLLQSETDTYDIAFHQISEPAYADHFLEWMERKGFELDTWIEDYKQKSIDRIKKFLLYCEGMGMKTLLFTWPNEYVEFINKDPFLSERFLKMEYKGSLYDSISDLMSPGAMHNKSYNPELTIKWDEESFLITPKDHHPSLKCHQVIADNIIKRIERDKLR